MHSCAQIACAAAPAAAPRAFGSNEISRDMKNIFQKSHTANHGANTRLDFIAMKNFYARERQTSDDQPMKTQRLTQSIASAFFLAACFVALASVRPASAASITWGSAQNITGDSNIMTTGSFIYAYNFGPDSVTATINGVTFSGRAVGTSLPSVNFGDGTISVAYVPNCVWIDGYNTKPKNNAPGNFARTYPKTCNWHKYC
jgi:hypothetical protein